MRTDSVARKTTKRQLGDEGKEGKYTVVIDQDLVPKLRVIAGARGVFITDLINNYLRMVVDGELAKALEAMGFKQSK